MRGHVWSDLHGAVRHFVHIISRGTEKVNALKSPAAFFFKTREIARGAVDASEFSTSARCSSAYTDSGRCGQNDQTIAGQNGKSCVDDLVKAEQGTIVQSHAVIATLYRSRHDNLLTEICAELTGNVPRCASNKN